MVLPAEHAETIRNLKNSSSVGASQIIINAVDAKSVERALLADDALLNVMRTFQRSGRI
jgi:hypothetical protein